MWARISHGLNDLIYLGLPSGLEGYSELGRNSAELLTLAGAGSVLRILFPPSIPRFRFLRFRQISVQKFRFHLTLADKPKLFEIPFGTSSTFKPSIMFARFNAPRRAAPRRKTVAADAGSNGCRLNDVDS